MNREKRAIILYIIVLCAILVGCLTITVFVIPNFFQESARIAIMIVWIVLTIVSVPIENDHTRFKGKVEKIKTTLIIVIIYYIFYFLLGLFFGYRRSPYSRSLFMILKNIFYVVGLIAMQDYVRTKVMNNERKKINYVIFTIIFIVIRLDYTEGWKVFTSGEKIFEYISSVIVPEIAKGCVCSYLAIAGGTLLVYAYSIPVAFAKVLLPIFPDLDWFLTSIFEVLISLIIFLYNNYEHTIKTNRLTRRQKKSISPTKKIPGISLAMLVVLFIAGLLPAKPIAIMSYSMVPTFSRGSVVISVNIKEDDFHKLQVGDILHYKSQNGDVIHRIIEIKEENGRFIFKTQGDNNNVPDTKWVEPEQVIGYVKVYVPYVGYPSVWFSEKILGKKSFITI
ncbi:MAG: signal peptidase I [Clostridiales bacterium]|nr:signal peptidase I [Clostridiales bacterium]